MIMKHPTFIFTGILMLLFSCTSTAPLKKAHWLIGTWENPKSSGSVYETWTLQPDQALAALSYKLNGTDTLLLETIQITLENGQLFFIPTVPTQNEGKSIRFVLTSLSKNEMVFENPEHDFPQRIRYRKIGTDSLTAIVSEIESEEETQRIFGMRKVK